MRALARAVAGMAVVCVAHAANADPIEFRMKLLQASTEDDTAFRRARSIAAVKAVAKEYGWDPRPSASKPRGTGDILTGVDVADFAALDDLSDAIERAAGRTMAVRFVRGGADRKREVRVSLARKVAA